MTFLITLKSGDDNKHLKYNTDEHNITDLEGNTIKEIHDLDISSNKRLKRFVISLGMACNYDCSYCLQKHEKKKTIEHSELDKLYIKMESLDLSEYKIEFWGGEPLLYIDTIYKILERFPTMTFSMITNGSILSIPMIDKLMAYNISISVSHDGPTQILRGKDPLEYNLKSLKYLFETYGDRCSLNSVLTDGNINTLERNHFFYKKLGVKSLSFGGEGPVVDYTKKNGEALQTSLGDTVYTDLKYRDGFTNGFYNGKIIGFLNSVKKQTSLTKITTSCGVDNADKFNANSLEGDKITCHNFKHNFKPVILKDRPECTSCPVVHLCKSVCPAIASDTELFKSNCARNFEINMAILRVTVELLFDNKYTLTNIKRI